MGQTVVFEVATQHAQAVAGFLQVAQAAEGVGRVGGDAGQKMKDGADKAGDSYGKMLGVLNSYPAAFLKMMSGATAVYASINQIGNEYERVNTLRGKAMQGLEPTHEPYKRLTMQTSEKFRESPKFKQMLKDSILGRGDAANALSVAANAFSAAGSEIESNDVADAATLVNQLAGAEGMTPADSEELMSELILSMQVDRRRGAKTSAKEVLGTILSEFPLSTAVDIGKLKYQMQFENPLVEYNGYSREETGSLSSVLGQLMGDPDVRRTRTAGLDIVRGLKEAYQFAVSKGMGFKDESGKEMSIDDYREAGVKQIEIARSKTDTGLMMRAYLSPRTEEERDMALGYIDESGMHTGKLQGEAGGKEAGEALINPDNKVMEDILKTIPHVKTGAAAAALVDERLKTKTPTRHEQYFERQRQMHGAMAYAQFENTTMAQQGAFNQLVEELGDVTGTGDLQQRFRGLAANLQSSGKTPEEIEELQREAVRQAKQDMLYRTTPQTDPNFLEWAKRNRSDQHRGVWGTVFDSHSEPYPRSVFEEYRRKTMPEDQKGILEAFDSYLEQPAAGGGARGGRASKGPAASGQSNLLEAMGRLEMTAGRLGEMAAALIAQASAPLAPIHVKVEDGLGRQLGRSVSQPRAIEQFNDPTK